MNVVLIGPMGSGKTSVGRRLAQSLGMGFFDTDEMIEKREGKTISRIFETKGEQYFREAEAQIIREVAKRDNCVISTGGGALLRNENARILRRNGVVISLKGAPEILLERLKGAKDRPLLAGSDPKKALEKIIKKRKKIYEDADFKIDVGGKGAREVVGGIIAFLKKPRARICASISGKSLEDCRSEIRKARKYGASMIELRLDLMGGVGGKEISKLIDECRIPVIATDRKNKSSLEDAINSGCDFVDIEFDAPGNQIAKITSLAKNKGVGIIASAHFFKGCPDGLAKIVEKLKFGDVAKVAAMANSHEDCKKIMGLLAERNGKNRQPLIAFSMGNFGAFTRIAAPLCGSYLTYAYSGKPAAPGQIDIKAMREIYDKIGVL